MRATIDSMKLRTSSALSSSHVARHCSRPTINRFWVVASDVWLWIISSIAARSPSQLKMRPVTRASRLDAGMLDEFKDQAIKAAVEAAKMELTIRVADISNYLLQMLVQQS